MQNNSDTTTLPRSSVGWFRLQRMARDEYLSLIQDGYRLMFNFHDSFISLKHNNGNRIDIKLLPSGLYILKNGKIVKHEMR